MNDNWIGDICDRDALPEPSIDAETLKNIAVIWMGKLSEMETEWPNR